MANTISILKLKGGYIRLKIQNPTEGLSTDIPLSYLRKMLDKVEAISIDEELLQSTYKGETHEE